MLHIEHLTKDYGDQQGIFNIQLDCEKGMIVGLLGNNGSGKTTLLKSILQLHPLNEGIITWNGTDIRECFHDIAYITDSLSFIPDMTPKLYGKFLADFYPKFDMNRYNKILKHFETSMQKKMRRMSKGQQLKIEIAAGFSQHASLLLLDEPFSNLDVFSKQDTIKMLISLLEDEETVLISSHDIDEIDHVIDRAILLKNGSILRDVMMDDLHDAGMTLRDCMNQAEAYDPNRVNQLFGLKKGREHHEDEKFKKS